MIHIKSESFSLKKVAITAQYLLLEFLICFLNSYPFPDFAYFSTVYSNWAHSYNSLHHFHIPITEGRIIFYAIQYVGCEYIISEHIRCVEVRSYDDVSPTH
ncbi:hypothetical protein PHYBLDRAFT_59420 [Phycomyces blakesleeanus NRRL 1555(-)]|uniref:Uncharacterized protein n=1 Tax=Phycomyces blakesleeanus (strain ATCC 8743b / DSM 1359 / FGSC 10004 / NBRC 33097 / NRRL 1555) TaxID=763407 RepID=A0A167NH66_PHYB8|nr:hypothetical protein PHYBLDRAFT_59420 [Phycomyces blakesleeanus NRRL 1555(-)]OAD75890.1 hypothetical protein PHYBLDRAFT_59420 [Phycomyces blakesleeanus NRRL 1555(-)]|eukprot:XP_018293930.1 hypothetical protein PHYBLDRAFT_59420 [Phycomyces blakesleeanus NRRL 1555(-)]